MDNATSHILIGRSSPLAHFYKRERLWLLEDEISGASGHQLAIRFHFNAGLEASASGDSAAVARSKGSGARLFVCSLDLVQQPEFESQFVSRDYGAREPSVSACWSMQTSVPCNLRWAILPVCADEDEHERLGLINRFR